MYSSAVRSLIAFSLLFFSISSSEAKVTYIQILHTNDLHAALETAGAPKVNEVEYGGWAQIKAKMDELRKSASLKGIETLQLDAGDFTEGTIHYFPDTGTHVLKAFQHMGYDAATIGNHDWLMGASSMNELYGKLPFSFPLLSANMKINSKLQNLKAQILPSTQIIKSGIKIGILGLSTDESLYSWIPRVNSGKKDLQIKSFADKEVSNENSDTDENSDEDKTISQLEPGIANKIITKLRDENDIVIALTHIGFGNDKELAASSRGLDLIIGGHSHTFLQSMGTIPDQDQKDVNIVQTGVNGRYIGRILIKYDTENLKNPVQVQDYELVRVFHDGPKDPVVAKDVEESRTAIEKQYGNRLADTIGNSEVRLVSSDRGPTAYGKFVVDAMRDITDADAALDIGGFHGNTPQPAGPITRQNLMMMYPRKFETEQDEGLYVYEAFVPGILIKIGLQYAVKYGAFVSTSGITYEPRKIPDTEFKKLKTKYAGTVNEEALTQFTAENIMIAGKPLNCLKWYRIAAPESLVRGLFGITSLAKLIVRHAHASSHTIWDAMNFYLLKTKVIHPLTPNDHFNAIEFSNSYRHHQALLSADEKESNIEELSYPWINELGSPAIMIRETISDVAKQLLHSIAPQPIVQ